MSELTPDLVSKVIAACETNAAAIAEALTRGIDAEISVSVGKTSTYDKDSLADGFDAGGLVVMMQIGDATLAALLPESSGIARGWMHEADAAGAERLHSLARELSLLVVPESVTVAEFGAAWADDLSTLLAKAKVADAASILPLVLDQGGDVSHLTMVWPCANPAGLLPSITPTKTGPKQEQGHAVAPPPPTRPKPKSLEQLPPYAKHLLKISVPVSVRLVSKKLPVKEVLELGPGAMISFDKSCDGPLELTVGDHVIAEGAAVKVGERFGLEIQKMTLPGEHFWPVRRTG
jgi:flagellar motor switch protein FliN